MVARIETWILTSCSGFVITPEKRSGMVPGPTTMPMTTALVAGLAAVKARRSERSSMQNCQSGLLVTFARGRNVAEIVTIASNKLWMLC